MAKGKLTAYAPAEDLTSDEAMAIFTAEGFSSGDSGYIAHALGRGEGRGHLNTAS